VTAGSPYLEEDAMTTKKNAERRTGDRPEATLTYLDPDDIELLAKLHNAPEDVASVVLQAQPFGTRAALEAYNVVQMAGRSGSQTLVITDFGWQVIRAAALLSGQAEQIHGLTEAERRAYERMSELSAEAREKRTSRPTVASADALTTPAAALGSVAKRSRAFGRRVHGSDTTDPAKKDRSHR
jgi:hypothetical protein